MVKRVFQPSKKREKRVFLLIGSILASLLLVCVLYNLGRYVNAYNRAYYNPAIRALGGEVTVHFQWYDWFNFSFNTSVDFPPEVNREQIEAAMAQYFSDLEKSL